MINFRRQNIRLGESPIGTDQGNKNERDRQGCYPSEATHETTSIAMGIHTAAAAA
jgi:hypothetical protein